jgi:hypothetical protein
MVGAFFARGGIAGFIPSKRIAPMHKFTGLNPGAFPFPAARAKPLNSERTAQRAFLPAAEDHPRAADASWTDEDSDLVIRTAKEKSRGPSALRITESADTKLVVRSA